MKGVEVGELDLDASAGVDIGSTNLKVVAMDADGCVQARAHRVTPRTLDNPSIDARVLGALVEEMLIDVCGSTRATGRPHGADVCGTIPGSAAPTPTWSASLRPYTTTAPGSATSWVANS